MKVNAQVIMKDGTALDEPVEIDGPEGSLKQTIQLDKIAMVILYYKNGTELHYWTEP